MDRKTIAIHIIIHLMHTTYTCMVKSDAFNFLVDFFAFPDKTLACLRLFLKLLFNIKIMYLKGMNTKNINS